MRKGANSNPGPQYKILAIDDETGILDSLKVYLTKAGYHFTGIPNPLDAIERIKVEHFDLLLLDFLMQPLHGDQVVERIREFNDEVYILLLTGHKDLAPPLETIRRLDIQGYCEKSDRFDQLLLLIEAGIKAISQMNIIKNINKELKDTYDKLENAYMETIEVLRYTVEVKDVYTRGHSDRVSELSVLIGRHVGLADSDLRTLKIGGLFHDIGKLGVPDHILLKESKLTDDEYSEIKAHSAVGEQILAHATTFKNIIPIVRHHHERYDGCGYPDKLQGENIPYLARIAAIADTFDAMTSKRSYRDPLSIDIVKEEFNKCKGMQFDPIIAEVFLNILDNDFKTIEEIQKKYR